ncbi:MAG: DUF6438 domain-containing protein, partial [Saprospiraceae bacterium]
MIKEVQTSTDITKDSVSQMTKLIEVVKSADDTILPPPVFKIDTILHIEQSGCYGKCEVYELNILNDGTAIWNGFQHTRLKGLNVARMERVDMSELMNFASTNSILYGPETYPDKNAYIVDFPNKKITIKSAIKVKSIVINNSPSTDLKKLISKIEFVVDHLE